MIRANTAGLSNGRPTARRITDAFTGDVNRRRRGECRQALPKVLLKYTTNMNDPHLKTEFLLNDQPNFYRRGKTRRCLLFPSGRSSMTVWPIRVRLKGWYPSYSKNYNMKVQATSLVVVIPIITRTFYSSREQHQFIDPWWVVGLILLVRNKRLGFEPSISKSWPQCSNYYINTPISVVIKWLSSWFKRHW